jgi:hypothetical protein
VLLQLSAAKELDLYAAIQKDVIREGAQGKAVINLSNSFHPNDVDERWISSAGTSTSPVGEHVTFANEGRRSQHYERNDRQ